MRQNILCLLRTPAEAWVFVELLLVYRKYFTAQVALAWKCHLLTLDPSTAGESSPLWRKDFSVALAVACWTTLRNSCTLVLLMAQGVLDIIVYCGTMLGRVGSDFSVLPRAWVVSYKAGDVALNLLRREENMKQCLLSSALASNEHEGNERLSIATFWIPASIALCSV